MSRKLWRLVVGICAGLLLSSISLAQSTFGSITGLVNVNVELAVGSTGSVVEVQATNTVITTETNDLSSNMGSQAVEQLPLVSRHTGDGGVYAYALFKTGVSAVPSSSLGVVQGARLETGTVPTMDGIAVMAYPFGASPVQPSLESVQEVSVVAADGPGSSPPPATFG
jgi:hypothetical protein